MEVKTIYGTERRDVIYTNESDFSFWDYIRNTYGSPFVMFETKNVGELSSENVNQTATYLGVRLGHFGVIVTRKAADYNIQKKLFSVYNDTASNPRKLILVLTDEDLVAMMRLKDSGEGKTPSQYMQTEYRQFRTSVQ